MNWGGQEVDNKTAAWDLPTGLTFQIMLRFFLTVIAMSSGKIPLHKLGSVFVMFHNILLQLLNIKT